MLSRLIAAFWHVLSRPTIEIDLTCPYCLESFVYDVQSLIDETGLNARSVPYTECPECGKFMAVELTAVARPVNVVALRK